MTAVKSASLADVANDPRWWTGAVIYHLYLPSFADSNGDGWGDLAGTTQHLDYLSELGVDAVWLSPFYTSPMIDAGYDVADHRSVGAMFGELNDFDDLVAAAHERGIKVLVDVIPNHTSSYHPWFQQALAAKRGSPARGRYYFLDGTGENGELPPNNWTSTFGGAAWTRLADGQWYMHTFHPTMPELNWEHPDVRADFEKTLRFWLGRGADGVRIDVAHGMAKPPGLPDLTAPLKALVISGQPDARRDADGVHEIHRWIRLILDDYPERMSVGEAWVRDADRQRMYLRDDELHSVFDFKLIVARWRADDMRNAIDGAVDVVTGTQAPVAWVLSNHDQIRHVTRYGDGLVGERRGRAAALLELALPGVHYLYMGDELALPSVDPVDEAKRDVSAKGRDNCRLPMPWNGTEPPYGFSENPATWLPAPAGWAPLTIERQQADVNSTWHLYRRAIAARDAFQGRELVWLPTPEGVLGFRRGAAMCFVNFRNTAVPMPAGELLLSSVPLPEQSELLGDAAVWLHVSE